MRLLKLENAEKLKRVALLEREKASYSKGHKTSQETMTDINGQQELLIRQQEFQQLLLKFREVNKVHKQ